RQAARAPVGRAFVESRTRVGDGTLGIGGGLLRPSPVPRRPPRRLVGSRAPVEGGPRPRLWPPGPALLRPRAAPPPRRQRLFRFGLTRPAARRPPGRGAAILISPERGSTRPSVTASQEPCVEAPCPPAFCDDAPGAAALPARSSSARERGAESAPISATLAAI